MLHIDEWHIPHWITLEWDAIPPAWKEPPQVPARTDPEANEVDAIRAAVEPFEPRALHCFKGEGLRWIRVGFPADRKLKPRDVQRVGRAIADCIPRWQQPLYFHALRPHDLLFFVKGKQEDGDRVGFGPQAYGVPLEQMLAEWGLAAGAKG